MPIIEPDFMELTRDLDLPAFWQENARSVELTAEKPRCPLSFSPDDHWVFEFMAVPCTLRYYEDKAYRDAVHRDVNRVTTEYVGRAFFPEDTWEFSPKRIENLFGCEFGYHEGSTPWLVPVTRDPAEFERILDRRNGPRWHAGRCRNLSGRSGNAGRRKRRVLPRSAPEAEGPRRS